MLVTAFVAFSKYGVSERLKLTTLPHFLVPVPALFVVIGNDAIAATTKPETETETSSVSCRSWPQNQSASPFLPTAQPLHAIFSSSEFSATSPQPKKSKTETETKTDASSVSCRSWPPNQPLSPFLLDREPFHASLGSLDSARHGHGEPAVTSRPHAVSDQARLRSSEALAVAVTTMPAAAWRCQTDAIMQAHGPELLGDVPYVPILFPIDVPIASTPPFTIA